MGFFSLPGDVTALILFGLIVLTLGGFGLHWKREVLKLDKIIAEKEAALNAPGSRPRRAAKASALHRRAERR